MDKDTVEPKTKVNFWETIVIGGLASIAALWLGNNMSVLEEAFKPFQQMFMDLINILFSNPTWPY